MEAGGEKKTARTWVYPASVKGRFQRIHRASGVLLQAFLFAVPWIAVGGRPAVQLDVGARRAFLLGHVFTASDTVFLVLLALFGIFSLFFFTALFGRLWCGFGCPQTVFLEEWVRPLEKWIEGERGVRMARDKRGWTFDRVWRKGAKWAAFAVLATVVGMTFTSWFVGARALWMGEASTAAYGVAGLFATALFFDFAWFREQFCNYLCPYARFQGALTDEGSLAVTYRVELGEPRRQPRNVQTEARNVQTEARNVPPELPATSGQCVACEKCVSVCPQGIDIREGFQLECVACARCIDACTGVMAKQGHESLIVFRSIEKKPLVRPRTVAYGALLAGISVALVAMLAREEDIAATVRRAPGTLYTVDPDGWIRNTFLVYMSNDSLEPVDVTFSAEGLPQVADLRVPPVHIEATGSFTAPLVIRVPPDSIARTLPFTLTLVAGETRVDVATTLKSGG